MMRIYLLKTTDYVEVVFVEGKLAKIPESAPSGKFCGVDLYAADAVEQLRDLLPTIELNSFDSMPGDEIPVSELKNVDADIELTLIGEYE